MLVKLHSYVLAFGLWDDTPHEKKKCPKTSNLIINDSPGFVNTIFIKIIVIGILALLMSSGSLIVAFLAFLDKRNKKK